MLYDLPQLATAPLSSSLIPPALSCYIVSQKRDVEALREEHGFGGKRLPLRSLQSHLIIFHGEVLWEKRMKMKEVMGQRKRFPPKKVRQGTQGVQQQQKKSGRRTAGEF